MKFHKLTRLLIALMAAGYLLTSPVSAEFFKYVDKNGVTHFVDDLSKIPTEYQDARQSYQEKYDQLPENERLKRIEQDRAEAQRLSEEQNARDQEMLRMQELEKKRIEQIPVPAAEETLPDTKVIIKGGHVFVPVVLGSGGYETEALLLLDTGATIVSLSRELADRLKIVPFKTARAQVANGKTVPYKLAELDFIIVGPHKMENLMVGIYQQTGPPMEHDGLLGMNVLKNLKYTIDFRNQVIKWKP